VRGGRVCPPGCPSCRRSNCPGPDRLGPDPPDLNPPGLGPPGLGPPGLGPPGLGPPGLNPPGLERKGADGRPLGGAIPAGRPDTGPSGLRRSPGGPLSRSLGRSLGRFGRGLGEERNGGLGPDRAHCAGRSPPGLSDRDPKRFSGRASARAGALLLCGRRGVFSAPCADAGGKLRDEGYEGRAPAGFPGRGGFLHSLLTSGLAGLVSLPLGGCPLPRGGPSILCPPRLGFALGPDGGVKLRVVGNEGRANVDFSPSRGFFHSLLGGRAPSRVPALVAAAGLSLTGCVTGNGLRGTGKLAAGGPGSGIAGALGTADSANSGKPPSRK
jgi:hypothetical protein